MFLYKTPKFYQEKKITSVSLFQHNSFSIGASYILFLLSLEHLILPERNSFLLSFQVSLYISFRVRLFFVRQRRETLLFQKLLFQKLLFPFVPRMSNDFLKNNSRLEQKRKGQFWITPKTPLFSKSEHPTRTPIS